MSHRDRKRCITNWSLDDPDVIQATTTILSQTNWTRCPCQRWAYNIAAKTMGASSFAVIGMSIHPSGHGSWNQCTSPWPWCIWCNLYRYCCSWNQWYPFSSRQWKHAHHNRSARNAAFRRIKWSGCVAMSKRSIIRCRKDRPGFSAFDAWFKCPSRDCISRFLHDHFPTTYQCLNAAEFFRWQV